ncbi:DinB family protein [Bacillus alkalicellulosilyticus]|uniref:DinB family protein n=1 Tax=Alkalihalobacterium alkalicellulosilyticum TaxID=1912214 RepID=UPI0009963013|nr:DinB family protein [Bacillus alkalicellulosilyticus]
MNFSLNEAIEVLERTPQTLASLLTGLSPGWVLSNEGDDTWNATEVIAHLIEGEKTNWLPRLEHILQKGKSTPFPEFDLFSHLRELKNNTLEQKLQQFKISREQNIKIIRNLIEDDAQLALQGTHPAFGDVKVRELLSTWVVHDLTHISQIVRVMAKRYRMDVGPWEAYLGVLRK